MNRLVSPRPRIHCGAHRYSTHHSILLHITNYDTVCGDPFFQTVRQPDSDPIGKNPIIPIKRTSNPSREARRAQLPIQAYRDVDRPRRCRTASALRPGFDLSGSSTNARQPGGIPETALGFSTTTTDPSHVYKSWGKEQGTRQTTSRSWYTHAILNS